MSLKRPWSGKHRFTTSFLAEKSPRLAEVVELRFFGGLTQQEIAEHFGVTDRTIRNDWNFAKAWLYDALSDE